jgi:hypothetical protein
MKAHELIQFEHYSNHNQTNTLPKKPSTSGRTIGTVTVSFGTFDGRNDQKSYLLDSKECIATHLVKQDILAEEGGGFRKPG